MPHPSRDANHYEIKAALESLGAEVLDFSGAPRRGKVPELAGTPDLLTVWPATPHDRYVWVEVKTMAGRLNDNERAWWAAHPDLEKRVICDLNGCAALAQQMGRVR